MMLLQTLKMAIEHAPIEPGPIADGLIGWTIEDLTICSRCASRLFGRGCGSHLKGAIPIWDDSGVVVSCCLCFPMSVHDDGNNGHGHGYGM